MRRPATPTTPPGSFPGVATEPAGRARLGGIELGRGLPVQIAGVINVSPESFYSGSVPQGRRALARQARKMVREGAAWLDVGAMTTAPYKKGWIEAKEEKRRLVEAIVVLRDCVDVPLSVDTQRAEVAAAAFQAGATILNDISGLGADPEMARLAAAEAAGVILMALEEGPTRLAPIRVVERALRAALQRARRAGIESSRILVDPGIGFFRQGCVPWHQFDCAVLRDLAILESLGPPLFVGVSRKSFIGHLTGRRDPSERLAGSLAAAAIAVLHGAAAIRTHDVGRTGEAVRIAEAIRSGG